MVDGIRFGLNRQNDTQAPFLFSTVSLNGTIQAKTKTTEPFVLY